MEDHKPLVDDLRNTGQELMDMCGDEDASDVKDDVDAVRAKYDDVKGALRQKLNALDEAFRNITSEVKVDLYEVIGKIRVIGLLCL